MSGKGFFGGILMWIGGAMMVLSGMCTLGVVFASVSNVFKDLIAGRFSTIFEAALVPLIVGGIPFVVGFGIWTLGIRIAGTKPYPDEPMPKEGIIPTSKDDAERMNKEIE